MSLVQHRWSLLRHTLPDSSWHYDWLIDRIPADQAPSRGPDARDLLAFRISSETQALPLSWVGRASRPPTVADVDEPDIHPTPRKADSSFQQSGVSTAASSFHALKLPDHRRLYLDFEGPLTHDRGFVRRLATGLCHWHQPTPDKLVVHIQPTASTGSDRELCWHGTALGAQSPDISQNRWIFSLHTPRV